MGPTARVHVSNDSEVSSLENKKRPHFADDDTSTAETGSTSGSRGQQWFDSSMAAKRTNLREQIMEEVLADYANMVDGGAHMIEVKKAERTWPFFRVRKALGLADVAVHDAVLDGDIPSLLRTMKRKMRRDPRSINDYDAEGRTALSLAVSIKREDIADEFLRFHHIDLNKADVRTGLTPMHHAVQGNLPRTLDRLLRTGADVNQADNVGMTALMLACRLGESLLVEILVDDFKADVSLIDDAGWTCLLYATFHGEGEIVEYLLLRGSNLDHRDLRGMTALDWSELLEHHDLSSFLDSVTFARRRAGTLLGGD